MTITITALGQLIEIRPGAEVAPPNLVQFRGVDKLSPFAAGGRTEFHEAVMPKLRRAQTILLGSDDLLYENLD
jgi:hypothetical protein